MQDFYFLGEEQQERRDYHKKARDAGNKMGILFCLLTVFQLTFSLLYALAAQIISIFSPEAAEILLGQVPMNFVLYLASFLVTTFIARMFMEMRQMRWYDEADKSPMSVLLPSEKVAPLDFIGAVAICLGAGMVGNIISTIFTEIFIAIGLPAPEFVFDMPDSTAGVVLYFISVAFLPPLLEEILCRGVIHALTKDYSPFISATISGITFALFHQNFAQYGIAFCMGFTMGYMLHRFKNIWICVAAHFINNFSVCMLDWLGGFEIVSESTYNLLSALYIYVLLGLGILAFILMLSSGRLTAERRPTPYKPLSKMILTPGYIIFIVISVALSFVTMFSTAAL